MNDAAPAPMPVTASVVVQPMGYSRYTEESGNRAVVTPVDMLDTGYPMRYEAGQRWGASPKLYLFAVPPGSGLHDRQHHPHRARERQPDGNACVAGC